MPQEQRTLEIQARLRDFVSKNAKAMLGAVQRFAKGAAGAFNGLLSKVVNLKNVILGFFVVLGARRVFQGLKQVADDLDGISKTADKVNATTRSLQELAYVAELNGTALDKLIPGLGQFATNLDNARLGSQDMQIQLERLGISMENLPLDPSGRVDLIELFGRIADASQTLESRTVALAAAQKVFGDAGRELGPILNLTSNEIRAMAAEAVRLGLVIDDAGLAKAAAFNDALSRLSASVRAVKFALFVDLAPRLAAVFEKAAQLVADNREKILALLRDLGRAALRLVDLVARGIFGLIKALERFFGSFLDPKKLRDQIGAIEQEMMSLEASGQGAAEAYDKLRRRRNQLEQDLQAGGLGDALEHEFDRLVASLGEFVGAFEEAWDAEPVERVDRAVKSVKEDVQGDFWGGFADGARQAWQGVTDLTAAGKEFGRVVVEGTLDNLSNAISDVILGVKSAKEAFKDFAKQVINDLVRMITKLLVVQTLTSFIPGGGGSGFFGLAQGGVMRGKAIPFEGFARGGIASRPTMALFGEAGAEAFVPLAHGKIPVQMKGRAGGGAVHVHFNVSAIDSRGVGDFLHRHRGDIAATVGNEVRNNIQLRDTIAAVR